MSVRITQRDNTALFLERLARVSTTRVTVGIHPREGSREHPTSSSESRATVADVGMILERGDQDRAPVAWLRNTIDGRPGLGGDVAAAAVRVLEGESPESAFAPLARELADEMRERMPIDTGRTVNAIGARVNGKEVE